MSRLDPNQKVNLVELGPGNCVNSKEFIKKFQDSGKLNKYIAIDISDEMLRIAQHNVNLWFPEIATETHKVDFESYTFPEILYKHKTPDIVNVLVMVGNTFGNVQDELRLLKNIEYSIYGEDIFVFINIFIMFNIFF